MLNRFADGVTDQPWLGRAADTLAETVKQAYARAGDQGLRVKSALNGVWLGHPLHAAITDVPLGAWTAAVVCDAAAMATGREAFEAGAGAAIAVGLVGAVGAAVAGATDWSDVDGRARRVGLLHGLLNVGATGLFAASWALRRTGRRGSGRGCALLGYLVTLAAAYLGGDLVYSEQVGVDHAAGRQVPEAFTRVLAAAELQEGRSRKVMVGDTPVLLVREDGVIRAIAETCSHLGGPLSEGALKEGTVVCPWHGSRFSLEDGHVVNGPATHPQPCFETRIRDGHVEIRMPRRSDAGRPSGGTGIAA
jgi:nitrite reductase/ring-hydroxylating ferredoxin subunit/uncharacterized membrane protein